MGRVGKEVDLRQTHLRTSWWRACGPLRMEKREAGWVSVFVALADIILWTSLHGHKAHKSLSSALWYFRQAFSKSLRKPGISLCKGKETCHFYVLTVLTLDSSGSGKDNKDGLWNNKCDNRAPEQISTESGHRWWHKLRHKALVRQGGHCCKTLRILLLLIKSYFWDIIFWKKKEDRR